MARHFIEEIRNETIIWWISCSGVNLNILLQRLAEKLGISNHNSAIEDLVDYIRIHLSKFKFMFVLDNFDVNCEDQKNILRVIINSDLQINVKFLITSKRLKNPAASKSLTLLLVCFMLSLFYLLSVRRRYCI